VRNVSWPSIAGSHRIPDRFRTICSDRQREVELFYDAALGTDLTTIDCDWSSFLGDISDMFSALPKPSRVVEPEIEAEIGTLVSASWERIPIIC
jgi:hypothetical protein